MKKVFMGLCAALFLMFPSDAVTQDTAQNDGGPDIQVGACAITTVKITFFAKEGIKAPPMEIEAPKGCRCSFMINGIEFIPTAPMPDSFCGIGDPEAPMKRDK
jgi:hypothetical protein